MLKYINFILICCFAGMCPEKNQKQNMAKISTVETLPNPIPGLFSVLTEEPDPLLRWTTHSYPFHLDLLHFNPTGSGLKLDLSGKDAVCRNREIRVAGH